MSLVIGRNRRPRAYQTGGNLECVGNLPGSVPADEGVGGSIERPRRRDCGLEFHKAESAMVALINCRHFDVVEDISILVCSKIDFAGTDLCGWS